MLNQSMASSVGLNQSQMSVGGSDPSKTNQLFDKIEKSNNLEIEERSMKNLSQKLNNKLVDVAYLANNNPQSFKTVINWIQKRYGQASLPSISQAVQILKIFSLKQEGKFLLLNLGALEFLDSFQHSLIDNPSLQQEAQEVLRLLVQEGTATMPSTTIDHEGLQSRGNFQSTIDNNATSNVFGRNLGSIQQTTYGQAMDQTYNTNMMMGQLPRREDILNEEEERKSTFSHSTTKTMFSKREFKAQVTPVAMQQTQAIRVEQMQMEVKIKQQLLRQTCELPFVWLSEDDEKYLFDLSVQLKFGDLVCTSHLMTHILNASQRVQHLAFQDFPIEVFLQRTDILRALVDLIDGAHGSVYTNLAQPVLVAFVQRLRNLYQYLGDSINKVSHVLQNERDQQVPLEPYLQHSYPCNHNGRWQAIQDVVDVNKYGTLPSGYSIKQQNMTAASLQNSMSCLAALGTILTKSIYLLKDTEKIGTYVQLINECLETLEIVFRVKENEEFSSFLHLCLFSFDSVCEFYKDAIFSEVLIKPVLPLALRVIGLLNTIQTAEKKQNSPFSECLLSNTANLQIMLRRTIFMNIYESTESTGAQIILTFFQRLEEELQGINLLQKGVWSSIEKANEAYKTFQQVQSFKLNAQGLIQNSESGIVFIETMTQYHQSLKVLEDLLHCLEMRMDFPYEHLIADCIIFGMMAEESSIDPCLDQLEMLFKNYLIYPHPEIRERIIRKIFQRIRLVQSISAGKRSFNNNLLLAKFINRKQILNQLVNGLLINDQLASEETRLQMTLGQMIVKILVSAYNEVGTQGTKAMLLTHFLTFHSQLQSYPDLIGMIDLIEESAQSKLIRFSRILRDLFNQDARKREFATSILKQSLSKDSMEYDIKDLVKETVDTRNSTLDLAFELEQINQNFDYSSFETGSILQLLMSSGTDYLIKKQSLDQLILLLFDVQNKRGRQFLKNQGNVQDLFSFIIQELIKGYNTCHSYLKNQVSLLDQNQINFLNECLKFLTYTYCLYFDEPEVKAFYDKFRLLITAKEKQDPKEVQTQEYLLNALVFFMGSPALKKNAIRVIHTCMFHQVFLAQKVIKQQQPNGSMKRAVQIYVPDFITKSFIIMLPCHAQQVKQPLKEELLLTEEQKMFITSRQYRQDYFTKDKESLMVIGKEFIQKVADRNEDYNRLMRSFEQLSNHVLSMQQLNDELVNNDTVASIIETLKVLPTRDFEFSFLADYLMGLNQILQSYKFYHKEVANLEHLVSKLCDGLKYHLIPYIGETGQSYFAEISNQNSDQVYSPKIYFVQRFLDSLCILMQVDLHLRQKYRITSHFQDKILNGNLIQFFQDVFPLIKHGQNDSKRKILLLIFNLINNYEAKRLDLEFLPELLITQIATQKQTFSLQSNSLMMISMRTLMNIHDRRLIMIQGPLQNQDLETSINLSQTSRAYLQKYQSFGWLVRLIESRDSRIRVLAWDLICELFDYEFLKQNPSIIQSAINSYLKHQELYAVKISVLKFLNNASDALIHNCDITREHFEQFDDTNYIGSATEQVSVKTLLLAITKQGLISQIYHILSQKDCPLIFLTLTMKLLHKLVLMDYKKALPVLTQLDYWTFLVEFINVRFLKDLEIYENRLIMKSLKETLIIDQNQVKSEDMVYLALNSIMEFIFEAFKRDQQLANLLVKTTKLMPNLFEVWQYTVEGLKNQTIKIQNNGILLIFVDKLIKTLHIALLHPRDYTIEVLKKFFFSPTKTYDQSFQPKCWVYFVALFSIVDKTSQYGSVYGVIDVRLALCRFVAEFLLRLPQGENNFLDEMIENYDAANLHKNHTRADLESFGSAILVQMGIVFKQLYVEKDLIRRNDDESDGQENQKIDICSCLSILLASCLSAKTTAVEQNLIKKVIEICKEHVSALILQEIQASTKKQLKTQNKSILGKSAMSNSMTMQSAFQSQMQRQFRYVGNNDAGSSEREILRMLLVLRHLFYNVKNILSSSMFEKRQKVLQQSKMSLSNTAKVQKHDQVIGDKFLALVGTIIEDLGASQEEITQEAMMTTITFVSQSNRFKNAIASSIPFQQNKKQTSLLRIIIDQIQREPLQANNVKLKLLFQVMRSGVMSPEIAKEFMKLKYIEDTLSLLQPQCKSEKDLRLIKHFLLHYSAFLAAFAKSEEGQKIILKLKPVFEFVLFMLDNITLSGQGSESQLMSAIVSHSQLFLRNVSFTRSNKLHFLSNESFLPCLLSFITNQSHPPRTRAYSVATLWMILYNHQGVKAALNRPEVISELQLLRQEFQRQSDISNYSCYVSGKDIIAQVDKAKVDEFQQRKLNEFTLSGLNGILKLLSQN